MLRDARRTQRLSRHFRNVFVSAQNQFVPPATMAVRMFRSQSAKRRT